MDAVAWTLFIAFIAMMLAFGIYHAKKIRNNDQYLLAGRATGLFALTATLVMTELNNTTIIAFSSLGYGVGWWAVVLGINFLFGLLFYAITVAKKWKNFNGVSVAHYFTERYSKDIGVIAGVILFLAMLAFSATYVKSLSLLFQPIFPHLNAWILSAALTTVVLLMTIRGGLVSIIRTDIVSFIATLIFIPLLLYFTLHTPSANPQPQLTLSAMQQKLPITFVLSLLFLTMFSYILAPWYGQKIVAAKTPRIAFLSVVLAAIIIGTLYSITIFTTSVFKQKGFLLSSNQLAYPMVIHTVLPDYLQGLDFAILLCISATTLAGVWNAMVTILIGKTPQQNIKTSMGLMFACGVGTFILANIFIDNVLNKMILANIPIVALSFTLLACFYWKRASRFGAYASIIVGLIVGTACYIHYGVADNYTWYWAIYGIPLLFIAGFFGSFASRRPG